eukprot:366000-Chlamydomonas_euryale.AAC.75
MRQTRTYAWRLNSHTVRFCPKDEQCGLLRPRRPRPRAAASASRFTAKHFNSLPAASFSRKDDKSLGSASATAAAAPRADADAENASAPSEAALCAVLAAATAPTPQLCATALLVASCLELPHGAHASGEKKARAPLLLLLLLLLSLLRLVVAMGWVQLAPGMACTAPGREAAGVAHAAALPRRSVRTALRDVITANAAVPQVGACGSIWTRSSMACASGRPDSCRN